MDVSALVLNCGTLTLLLIVKELMFDGVNINPITKFVSNLHEVSKISFLRLSVSCLGLLVKLLYWLCCERLLVDQLFSVLGMSTIWNPGATVG